MTQADDEYSTEETARRLRRTLQAAFNMKPTPLKVIVRKRNKPQRTPPAAAKAHKRHGKARALDD